MDELVRSAIDCFDITGCGVRVVSSQLAGVARARNSADHAQKKKEKALIHIKSNCKRNRNGNNVRF
jgi:hypothetical protein